MNYKQLLLGVLAIAVLAAGAYFIFGVDETDDMRGDGPYGEFEGKGGGTPPIDEIPPRDGTGPRNGTGLRDGSGMGTPSEVEATDDEGLLEAEVSVEETVAVDVPAVDDGGYTLAQVARHTSEEDCWTAINGTVYDVTAFFGKHPGGDKNLFRVCGIDATEVFERKHGGDEKPNNVLQGFEIGVFVQ